MERQHRHLRVVQNVRPMRHVLVGMVPHLFVTVERIRVAVDVSHVHHREHRRRAQPVYRHVIFRPVQPGQMAVERINIRPTVIIDDLHQIFSSENCFMRVFTVQIYRRRRYKILCRLFLWTSQHRRRYAFQYRHSFGISVRYSNQYVCSMQN